MRLRSLSVMVSLAIGLGAGAALAQQPGTAPAGQAPAAQSAAKPTLPADLQKPRSQLQASSR